MPVILGLIAGLFIANSQITPADLERQIERGLRERLGQVQEVHVKLKGPHGYRMLRGNFSRAEVTLKGFDFSALEVDKLVPGSAGGERSDIRTGRIGELMLNCSDVVYESMEIDQLVLRLKRVRYDVEAAQKQNQISLISMESGTADIRIAEWSLNRKVASLLPDVSSPRVRLTTGGVVLTGRKTILALPIPFSVSGKLRGRNNEVYLVDPELNIGILRMPHGFADRLLGEVNPVFAFDPRGELPFTLEFTSLTARGKTLSLQSDVDLRVNPTQATGSR